VNGSLHQIPKPQCQPDSYFILTATFFCMNGFPADMFGAQPSRGQNSSTIARPTGFYERVRGKTWTHSGALLASNSGSS